MGLVQKTFLCSEQPVMIRKGYAVFFLALLGFQALGLLLCCPLPLWMHRLESWHALKRAEAPVPQPVVGFKLAEVKKPHRPHTPQDFTWREGVEHFRGHPLVVLGVPKVLEAVDNERFVKIHSREFRFDGQMYDIVRTRAGIDTTWYTVYADYKEGNLLAQRDQALKVAISTADQALKSRQDTGTPWSDQSMGLLLRLAGPAVLPGGLQGIQRLEMEVEGLAVVGQLCKGNKVSETPPPRLTVS